MDVDLVINGFSVVAVIYGVIQAAKMIGLKDSVAPAVAIGIGVLASSAYAVAPAATEVVVRGAALGVAAMVSYAGLKKTANNA